MPPRRARPPRSPIPVALLLLALAATRRGRAPLLAATAAWILARPSKPSAAPDSPATEALRRELHALEARGAAEAEQQALAASRLRHDVRGALSPALLIADRLTMAEEPDKKRAGELISRAVGRAVELLRKPADP